MRAACAGVAVLTACTIGFGAIPAQADDASNPTTPTSSRAGGIGFGRIPGFTPVPTSHEPPFTSTGAGSDIDVPVTVGANAGTSVHVPAQPETVTASADGNGGDVPVALTVGSTPAGVGSTDASPSLDDVPVAARTAEATGTPGAVAVHAWTTRAYPAADATLAAIPLTVAAVDTNGAPLAIHGEAVVTCGGATRSTAFDSATGSATFLADATGLPLGDATVSITVSGPASAAPVASTVPATLIAAEISTVAAQLPYTTVYPVEDGYRDALTIKLDAKTTTGTAVKAHGWASILHDQQTVAKWKLTSSSAVLRWSGRVASALKPGRYQLRLSVAGPQGRTSVVTRSLAVSRKKLTRHTRIAGYSVVGEHGTQRFSDESAQHGALRCSEGPTALDCRSTTTLAGAASRIALAPVVLPQAAIDAERYGPLQVRFITTVSGLSGTPRWIPAGVRSDPVQRGRYVYKWLTLPKGAFEIPITLQLGPKGRVALVGAELQYRYTTLE